MIDRMILKRVELLPHASFQQVERDIGLEGEKLIAYANGIVERIRQIGDPDYRPRIHLDVYGTLGELFGGDVDAIAVYLGELEAAVRPHELLLESFVIAESREAQIEAFRALRAAIARQGIRGQDHRRRMVQYARRHQGFRRCRGGRLCTDQDPRSRRHQQRDRGGALCPQSKGMGCCLGGTGNETDQSARITAQIGLACQPDFLLSKPGFGGDEALDDPNQRDAAHPRADRQAPSLTLPRSRGREGSGLSAPSAPGSLLP